MKTIRPVDLDVLARNVDDLLGPEGGEVLDAIKEITALRAACSSALALVERTRIVPGGDRHKLQIELRAALGMEEE